MLIIITSKEYCFYLSFFSAEPFQFHTIEAGPEWQVKHFLVYTHICTYIHTVCVCVYTRTVKHKMLCILMKHLEIYIVL